MDSDAKLANKIVRDLRKHSVIFHYPNLDRKILQTRAYTNSSYVNNEDLSAQIGFMVCHSDAKIMSQA